MTSQQQQHALIAALTRLCETAGEALPNTQTQTEREATIAMIAFSFGPYRLLVDGYTHCDLLPQAAVSAMPLSPPMFSGLINHRGQLISVYQALNAPANARGHYVLVVGQGEERVGLYLTEKPRIVHIHPDAIQPVVSDKEATPPTISGGIFTIDAEHYHCISGHDLGPWLLQWAEQTTAPASASTEQ